MAIDIKELFNDKLPVALERNKAKAQAMKGRFQINITGEKGGSWYIDCISDPPSCVPGTGDAPDATLTISDSNFQELAKDPAKKAPGMYMWGKIKIEGSTVKAISCAKLLGTFVGK